MSVSHVVQPLRLGAVYRGKGTCLFNVWAPLLKNVSVNILSPRAASVPLERCGPGYWKAEAEAVPPGSRYTYRLDGQKDRPDPASRFQPEGVHGPSQVVDPGDFEWRDEAWRGILLRDYIIYELHVGTFTPPGTFDAAAERLDYLKDLGITAIEIMPVAQFPGSRNWGYDGVYPFAPQNTYGGPRGLKALVNACHRTGIAVILDVVYNHLGPDGNYLNDFGPYFTPKYRTPWGDAVNYDDRFSDEVRTYFIENALYWITEYHIDALRLDAVDTIYDNSPKHILAAITEAVHGRAGELERQIHIIAESDLNDVKVINPPEIGGYGLDAQWNDDFHHALHALVTGERKGYYQDFGDLAQLRKAFQEGFVYSGQYSRYRQRRHGNSSAGRPCRQFVVCSQNHDQVGNRMRGERLSGLLSFEQLKLAAGCVLLSPFVPLLFMGEEYGEKAPFQYFVSYTDEPLIKAVREGRTREFARFEWDGEVPDPQDEETFRRSKLDVELRKTGNHRILWGYYRFLLDMRKSLPALATICNGTAEAEAFVPERALFLGTEGEQEKILLFLSFSDRPTLLSVVPPSGTWSKLFDSSSPAWGGTAEHAEQTLFSEGTVPVSVPMNPHSIVLYTRETEER